MNKEALQARLKELRDTQEDLQRRYLTIDGAAQEVERFLEELSKEETKE